MRLTKKLLRITVSVASNKIKKIQKLDTKKNKEIKKNTHTYICVFQPQQVVFGRLKLQID